MCKPADYLPSGTVGQWPPATGQWWNERRGGDPRTDHATQRGLTHNSRTGNPKRLRSNCHSSLLVLSKTAWVAQNREGAQGPQCAKGRGPKDPGVAAPLPAAVCRGNCQRDTDGRPGLLAELLDSAFCRASAYSQASGSDTDPSTDID